MAELITTEEMNQLFPGKLETVAPPISEEVETTSETINIDEMNKLFPDALGDESPITPPITPSVSPPVTPSVTPPVTPSVDPSVISTEEMNKLFSGTTKTLDESQQRQRNDLLEAVKRAEEAVNTPGAPQGVEGYLTSAQLRLEIFDRTIQEATEPKYTMDSLNTNREWLKAADSIYKFENDGEKFKGSKNELAIWLKERHSDIGWNFYETGKIALTSGDMPEDTQKAWLDSINIYTDTEGDAGSALRALSNATVEDPLFWGTAFLTLGWGGIAKVLGSRAAGAAGIFAFKEQLKKSLAKGMTEGIKKELGEGATKEAIESIAKQEAAQFAKIGSSLRVTPEILKGARKEAAHAVGKNLWKLNVPIDTALVGGDEIARQSFRMDIDSDKYDEGMDYEAVAWAALRGGGLSFGVNRFLEPVQQKLLNKRALQKATAAREATQEKLTSSQRNLPDHATDNDITTAAIELQRDLELLGKVEIDYRPKIEVKTKGKSKEVIAEERKKAKKAIAEKEEALIGTFRRSGIDLVKGEDGVFLGTKNRSEFMPDADYHVTKRGTGETLLAKIKRGMWSDAGVKIKDSVKDFAQIRRGVDTAQQTAERNIMTRFKALTKSIKEDYGVKDFRALDKQILKSMDDALRGRVTDGTRELGRVAPRVTKEIGELRDNINSLQEELLKSGAIKEDSELYGIIQASMKDGDGELYITRAYEVFDNPEWGYNLARTEAGDKIIREAKAFIASNIGVVDDKFAKIKIAKDSGKELSYEDEVIYDYYMNPTTGYVKRTIDSILNVHSEDDLFKVFQDTTKFGKNPLKILTEKGDIPDQIRLLMGEYENPFTNYANTMTKLFQTIEQFKYEKELSDLINDGKIGGAGLYDADAARTVKLGTQFTPRSGVEKTFLEQLSPIEKQLAETASPLYDNPLFANKQIADAILSGNEIGPIKNKYWQTYLLLQGHTRAAKTVYSLTAISRNFLGAAWMSMGAGYMRPAHLKGIRDVAKGLSMFSDDVLGAEIEKGIYLGNIQSGTDIGSFRGALKDAGESSFWDGKNASVQTKKGLVARAKHFNTSAVKFYQSMDDMWKQFAFLNEKSNYGKVLADKAEAIKIRKEAGEQLSSEEDRIYQAILKARQQGKAYNPEEDIIKEWMSGTGVQIKISALDEYASHQVSRHMQNYAGVPQFVRYARLLPIADFLAFTTEMLRTQKNILKDSFKDMREGRELMKLGLRNEDGTLMGQAQAAVGERRLGSIIAAQSAAPAIAYTSAQLTGMNEKAKDAKGNERDVPYTIREGFQAFDKPWEKGADWLWLGKAKDGKVRRVNLSYINPWGKIKDPIVAASRAYKRGEYVDGAIQEAMKETMWRPITEALGVSMLADSIVGLDRNIDQYGRPIWREDDPAFEKIRKGAIHEVETFEPGFLKFARETSKIYTMPEEALTEKREVPFFDIPYETKIGVMKGGRKLYEDDQWMSQLGIKPQTLDIKEQIGYKLNSFKRRLGQAKNVFKDVYESHGAPVTKDEILDSYRESLQRQYNVSTEMYDFVQKARSAGLTKKQIIDSVTKGGLFTERLDKKALAMLVKYNKLWLPPPGQLHVDIRKASREAKTRTGVKLPIKETTKELKKIYRQFQGSVIGE